MTTTKITRKQLKVLEDTYTFEQLLSDGPRIVNLGLYVEPQWEDALTGETLENAKTLERDLINAVRYVHDPVGVLRQSLIDITLEALGLDNSKKILDMCYVWELVHHLESAQSHLYFLQAHTKKIAQGLGQEYDNDEKLNAAIETVVDLFQMARHWQNVAAQRFVETGSARPAGEAAK